MSKTLILKCKRLAPHLPLYLIRVFEDEVFALLQLATDVDHTAQDAPGILHAQVNLAGKLVGLELLCAKDNMPRRVLDMITGDIPKEKRTRSEKPDRKKTQRKTITCRDGGFVLTLI